MGSTVAAAVDTPVPFDNVNMWLSLVLGFIMIL